MTNVKAVISAFFKTALRGAYPTYYTSKPIVQNSGAERFGDYKCIVAMPLANVREKERGRGRERGELD